jgi:hypothetical protein
MQFVSFLCWVTCFYDPFVSFKCSIFGALCGHQVFFMQVIFLFVFVITAQNKSNIQINIPILHFLTEQLQQFFFG